jgi:transposase
MRYVGIDLHKRLLVACIVDEKGGMLASPQIHEVTRRSLEEFCREHLRPDDHVAMEVTTHVWAVVRIVEQFVARVVASNPMATKAIAQAKVKTDKVDAHVLAQLLRLDFLPTVWAPDKALSRLRELTGRRNRLVQDRTKIINRIRTCLAMRLLDCPYGIPEKCGREWLQSVELDDDGRFLVDSDLRLLDAVQAEIDTLDKHLAQRVYNDQRVKLLMTLPGVSQNVAQAVVAAVGDIHRFETPEKLAAYLGLVPSTRQSANRCYHGGITKAGRVDARWALVQAAHAVRCDLGPLGYFFNKLRRRKNYNIAICAVARKLAILSWHLLTTGLPYRYAKPDTVAGKLSKLRIAGTGMRRRTGVRKGIDTRVMRPAEEQNMKRTPSLNDVLAKEGLPAPTPPKKGDRRILERTGCLDYFESLQQERVRPRKSSKRRAVASSSNDPSLEDSSLENQEHAVDYAVFASTDS